MATTFINLANYPNLNQFGVLAGTTITDTGPIATLTNGYYGTSNNTYVPPTPFNVATQANILQIAAAQIQLTQLISNINALIPTQPLLNSTYGAGITFEAGNVYKTNNTALTFNGGNILFNNTTGNPNAQIIIISTADLTIGPGVTLTLGDNMNSCNIFWLANAAITGTFSDATTAPMYGNFIAGTAATFTYPSSMSGFIYAKTAITIDAQTSVNTTTINTSNCNQYIICYLKGTLILTKKGFIPIEDIRAGDKVVTKGKIHRNKFIKANIAPRLEPVFWVSKFKVTSLNSKSRPICIKKDALGKNYPFKDLYVSPGHSLLLNGRMVLAKNIVNETTIYQDKELNDIEYYHLECEDHSAIFANGVLAESYLDINNRDVFENSIRLKGNFNFKKMNFTITK